MKRILSLMLGCMMALAMFANAGAIAEQTPVDWTKHQEFSIWIYSTTHDLYSGYSNNPGIRYLNEKFNVTLNFEQPVSGTEADSLALMLGTGEYTDMIDTNTYTGSVNQLFEDGVIVDLAAYLDYMPNLKARFEQWPDLRKFFFDDNGRMLRLRNFSETVENMWGGLVYRHDILDAMTGGNVQFPSGNAEPITLEDWDYMLPLFKQYFEAAGMAHGTPLILPSGGAFYYGELASGFGFHGPDFYTEDGKVKHGYLSEGFYNYIMKMREWYQAGYIYPDFASRVNDMFYLPNTELTYGGAAGVWFGLGAQLGDSMSMPEYGLFFDVRPISSPLDTAHGITGGPLLNVVQDRLFGGGSGSVVTTKCADIPKLVSIIDYMYSDEGGLLWQFGLTKDQIPAGDTIYASAGLQDGSYWFEGETFTLNPELDVVGGPVKIADVNTIRLPGYIRNNYLNQYSAEITKKAAAAWMRYDEGKIMKLAGLNYSAEEEKTFKENSVGIVDYANSQIPQYIMGTTEFNPEVFEAFKQQLITLGLEENMAIHQAAYDRFLSR